MYHLTLNGIDFAYGKEKLTLNNITLDIKNPQLISIIGPNGVGKSTLIHCMNRVLSPVKGTVIIDDLDISTIKIKDLARKVGYVPQAANDTFPLTVVDTILMGRNPHNKWRGDHKKDMEIVKKVLEMMDIVPLAMRPFNELSAGQHQRVMLARGLAQEPDILLLDEPTANLDIRHQMDVTRLLKKLSLQKDIVIIMISHDLNLAAKYSDNVIMMSNGGIFAVGKPEDVITKENIKAVYNVDSELIEHGGRPHMILLDPNYSEADLKTRDGSYVLGEINIEGA